MLRRINPPELFDGSTYSMSQGIVDESTGLVYLSGQVAWDEAAQVRVSGYGEQTEMALKNLGIALAAAGSSADQIVRMRIYVRGEIAQHAQDVSAPIVRFLDGARPAMTGIGVASLATPDTLVEIEVVARRAEPQVNS